MLFIYLIKHSDLKWCFRFKFLPYSYLIILSNNIIFIISLNTGHSNDSSLHSLVV